METVSMPKTFFSRRREDAVIKNLTAFNLLFMSRSDLLETLCKNFPVMFGIKLERFKINPLPLRNNFIPPQKAMGH
jgi:hypothetical protein